MNEDKNKEINIKIEKAKATFDDVLFLIENEKLEIAVNRLYYSIFYILCALAEKNNFGTSKHTQLIGWFNKNYVAENKISKEISKTAHKLFDLRTKADYDFYSVFESQVVKQLYNEVKIFIDEVIKLI